MCCSNQRVRELKMIHRCWLTGLGTMPHQRVISRRTSTHKCWVDDNARVAVCSLDASDTRGDIFEHSTTDDSLSPFVVHSVRCTRYSISERPPMKKHCECLTRTAPPPKRVCWCAPSALSTAFYKKQCQWYAMQENSVNTQRHDHAIDETEHTLCHTLSY
jgi:hypothetical protein